MLNKKKVSKHLFGQIKRYMGNVIEFVSEDNQQLRGIIIALDEDYRIKFALKVAKVCSNVWHRCANNR